MTPLKNPALLDRAVLPQPVLEDAPELIELYWAAWEMAWDHIVARDEMTRSPYMDEGFDPETIWIWDTCFMAHFCKYAPATFPGIESLENFYAVMYDHASSAVNIHHPDNPPLFAWTEYEYVRHTGDFRRISRLLDSGYLQKHFEFFDSVPRGSLFPYSNVPTEIERTERGYRWNGVCSGMDNTPRAGQQGEHGTYGDILWFDAAAQQALAARSIAQLASLVGRDEIADEFDAHHRRLITLVNTYWDSQDAIYYDRDATAPYDFHRVKTPAVYWPLLAGACDDQQAQALADKLIDPTCFGGPVPWSSVARDEDTFRPKGHYWRGGVWIPIAYMSARSLADNGYAKLAATASRELLDHMARTYADYNPSTIWEAYAPNRAAPSTDKDDEHIVRADFCGWSALAPISMLIEHVLGFRVDAVSHTVTWTRPGGAVGIRRLRCGGTTLDVVDDGTGTLTIVTDTPLRLVIDGTTIEISEGGQMTGTIQPDGKWTSTSA